MIEILLCYICRVSCSVLLMILVIIPYCNRSVSLRSQPDKYTGTSQTCCDSSLRSGRGYWSIRLRLKSSKKNDSFV